MNIKQATGVYFSPTGRSRKAVGTVLAQFTGYREELDLTAAKRRPDYVFTEDEVVVMGAPVYAGRLPQTAVERFRRLKGHKTPAVILVTYGSRDYEDALVELEDVMQEQGFSPIAAAAVVASHNIMPKIAEGRPNGADLEKLSEFGRRCAGIVAGLAGSSRIGRLEVPGSRPYRPYQAFSVKIRTASCTDCGLCIRECPVQAISRTDPKIMDEERCISCMRCVEVCPQGSRRLSSILLLAIGLKLKKSCDPARALEFYFGGEFA